MEETTLARAYVANDAHEVSSLDFNVNVSQLNELTQSFLDISNWYYFLLLLLTFFVFGGLLLLKSPTEATFNRQSWTGMVRFLGYDDTLLHLVSDNKPLDALHRDYEIDQGRAEGRELTQGPPDQIE